MVKQQMFSPEERRGDAAGDAPRDGRRGKSRGNHTQRNHESVPRDYVRTKFARAAIKLPRHPRRAYIFDEPSAVVASLPAVFQRDTQSTAKRAVRNDKRAGGGEGDDVGHRVRIRRHVETA